MVFDSHGRIDHPPVLSALTIEERELALGFPVGCTDAPFLAATPEDTYASRHRIQSLLWLVQWKPIPHRLLAL